MSNNFIHPTAIIDPSVTLGEGNYIGPYCLFGKNAIIGDNNRFEAFCSIAQPPEHRDFKVDYKSVIIGSGGTFREKVVINSGTRSDTVVGDRVFLMDNVHVGHDSLLESDVTVAPHTGFAGHCIVHEGANIGLGVMVHQYCRIGHYAMLGMGCIVTKKSTIEPFKIYIGNPATFLKDNDFLIKRLGMSDEQVEKHKDSYLKLIDSYNQEIA